MLGKILNNLHLFLIFTPPLLYLLPRDLIRPYLRHILLILALTPIQWNLLGGQCILTVLAKKFGMYKKTISTSEFSESNLKWLYYPIMRFAGLKWNSKDINTMANLHLMVNILLVWNLMK